MPRSRPRYQLALCLQEKEIMKELLENGPVQGRELLWVPTGVLPRWVLQWPGDEAGGGRCPAWGWGLVWR